MFVIKVKYGAEVEEELEGVYKSYEDAWCAMTVDALDNFLHIEHEGAIKMHDKSLFHYNNADLIISEDIDPWYNVLVTYRVVETGVEDRPGVYINVTNGDINSVSIYDSRESQLEDFVDRVIDKLKENGVVFSSMIKYSREDIKRLIKNRGLGIDRDTVLGTLKDSWHLKVSDLSFSLYTEVPEYAGFTVKSYYRVVN